MLSFVPRIFSLTVLLGTLLLQGEPTFAALEKRHAGAPEPVVHRTIVCPADRAIGTVLVAKEGDVALSRDLDGTVIHQAKGTFTCDVPPHSVLILNLNVYGTQNSDLLSKVRGIDGLMIHILALDDEAKNDTGSGFASQSDKAIHNVSRIGSLRFLDVSRSDVTDAGLKSLVSSTKLEKLSVFCSAVIGSSLGALATLPNLTSLDLGSCPIPEANLRFLPNFKKLSELNMDGAKITVDGAAYIGKCRNLEDLALPHSKYVNDQVLAQLTTCKHLKKLDLRRTRVTPNGLFKLASPNLKILELTTDCVRSNVELSGLKHAFPKAQIVVTGSDAVNTDLKTIFAPITR